MNEVEDKIHRKILNDGALSIFILATHTLHSRSLFTLVQSISFIRPTNCTMADDAGAFWQPLLWCIFYVIPLPPWLEIFFAALESFVLIFKFAATLNQCCRSSGGNLNPCYTMFKRMGLFLLIMYLMIPCCNALVSISLFLLMIFHCIRTISNRNDSIHSFFSNYKDC